MAMQETKAETTLDAYSSLGRFCSRIGDNNSAKCVDGDQHSSRLRICAQWPTNITDFSGLWARCPLISRHVYHAQSHQREAALWLLLTLAEPRDYKKKEKDVAENPHMWEGKRRQNSNSCMDYQLTHEPYYDVIYACGLIYVS
ncbi:TPA: hypothetical protein ACH3X1_001759 [Trebouxia sp. C0004]